MAKNPIPTPVPTPAPKPAKPVKTWKEVENDPDMRASEAKTLPKAKAWEVGDINDPDMRAAGTVRADGSVVDPPDPFVVATDEEKREALAKGHHVAGEKSADEVIAEAERARIKSEMDEAEKHPDDGPAPHPKYAIMYLDRVRRIADEWPTDLANGESVLELPLVDYPWLNASRDEISHLRGVKSSRDGDVRRQPPVELMKIAPEDMPAETKVRLGTPGGVEVELLVDTMASIMGGGGDSRASANRILEMFASKGWQITASKDKGVK